MLENLFINQIHTPWLPVIILTLVTCVLAAIKILVPKKKRWRQKAAKRVLERLQTLDSLQKKLAYLRKIDAFIFEELILEAFERRGCRVERNRRYTGDGGIDGKLWIYKQLYLVQAKRYSNHISAAHVREFVDLCAQHRSKGIFVHTGRTGKLSKEIAQQCSNVTIISGERLIQLVTPLKNTTQENTGVISNM